MSNLIVIGFNTEADAFEMRAALAKLQSQFLIEYRHRNPPQSAH